MRLWSLCSDVKIKNDPFNPPCIALHWNDIVSHMQCLSIKIITRRYEVLVVKIIDESKLLHSPNEFTLQCLWTLILPPDTLNIYYTLLPSVCCKVLRMLSMMQGHGTLVWEYAHIFTTTGVHKYCQIFWTKYQNLYISTKCSGAKKIVFASVFPKIFKWNH